MNLALTVVCSKIYFGFFITKQPHFRLRLATCLFLFSPLLRALRGLVLCCFPLSFLVLVLISFKKVSQGRAYQTPAGTFGCGLWPW